VEAVPVVVPLVIHLLEAVVQVDSLSRLGYHLCQVLDTL
jgi:hypothetical protein